jgi:hypothetical protein
MFEEMKPTETTFRVDLHAVRGGDRVSTRISHATGPVFEGAIQPGCWVQVLDEDGGTVSAIVEQVTDRRIQLKLDWSTWQPAHRPLPQPADLAGFGVSEDLAKTG